MDRPAGLVGSGRVTAFVGRDGFKNLDPRATLPQTVVVQMTPPDAIIGSTVATRTTLITDSRLFVTSVDNIPPISWH